MNKQQIIENEKAKLKRLILGTIQVVVFDFVFDDRKEDEELPQGAMEEAMKQGIITKKEMINKFAIELDRYINDEE